MKEVLYMAELEVNPANQILHSRLDKLNLLPFPNILLIAPTSSCEYVIATSPFSARLSVRFTAKNGDHTKAGSNIYEN